MKPQKINIHYKIKRYMTGFSSKEHIRKKNCHIIYEQNIIK